MPFDKKVNKEFFIKDNHIELSKEYLKEFGWRFKKITGTRFTSIIGLSKYNSPFKTWCMMVGIYSEEMDPTLAKIGQYAEPKIRDYVSKLLGIKFKDYVPAQVKWDVFKDVDKVFGGIPDGEPIDANGNFTYNIGQPMLEVKTSSIDKFVYKTIDGQLRMQKDSNGIPLVKEVGAKKKTWFVNEKLTPSQEYMGQLGLYLYLRGVDKGMFAVGFLTPDEYANPQKFVASSNNVYTTNFSLKDRNLFKQYVEQAREWYMKYVKTGVSPEMTSEDVKWLSQMLKI